MSLARMMRAFKCTVLARRVNNTRGTKLASNLRDVNDMRKVKACCDRRTTVSRRERNAPLQPASSSYGDEKL